MQIFFFFRSPFYFSFFWIFIFVLHFLTWVMIFYGDPLLSHWGYSFWIDVEWTFPSFLLRAFLPWDHRSDGNTVSWCPGRHTRDVCAQNSESRFKSMLLVGLLISTQTYVCYGPSFCWDFALASHCSQWVFGENFHPFNFSFSPSYMEA